MTPFSSFVNKRAIYLDGKISLAKKKKKQNKPQYLLDTTMRKQAQIT
jgi:hypothetical protein